MTLIQETDQTEFATWREQRLAELQAPDGFLSLVGLCWLQSGPNRFGAAPDNPCLFPAGLPGHIGTYTVADDGKITVVIQDGVTVTHNGEPVTTMPIATDRDAGGATILELGPISWFVIKRGDALGIRIRDSQSDTLQRFSDVERFPYGPAWRLTGRFMAHDTPQKVPVPTILGTDSEMISPGKIELTIAGERRSITALMGKTADSFFLIIADDTSGHSTYGGGRFLNTEPLAEDGTTVVVDFNKATNPPCAFTPYATCPLPPEGNRFNLPIEAGEKNYGHH